MAEQLLQHADDLDFVQDTLTASGSSLQLNPLLNGVLAGFNRRRRHQRFKYGHRTLEFDRLRFAQTASDLDSDLLPRRSVMLGRILPGRKRGQSRVAQFADSSTNPLGVDGRSAYILTDVSYATKPAMGQRAASPDRN